MAFAGPIVLSVIIPVFNAMDYIPDLFESLCLQEWSRWWEVVVADNGSRDASLAMIETYRRRLPRLKILEVTDGQGSAYARNAGARAAEGSMLLFVDHDDVLADGYIRAMGTALEEQEFVCARWEVERLNAEWTYAQRPSGQWEGPMDYNYDFLPYAAGGTLGIRRETFEAVGGFDPAAGASNCSDLCWRVQLETGAELGFVPEAIVHYRYRDSLPALFLQAREWGRSEVGMYKRWKGRGVATISWWKSVKHFGRLIKPQFLKLLGSRAGWAWWATELGSRLGRIEGSVRMRTFML